MDEVRSISPPEPQPVSIQMDVAQLEQLKQKDHVALNLQIDLVWMPAIIQETRDSRPYYPYLLILVDGDQGFVLGSEMFSPFPTLEAMWSKVPGMVVEQLSRLGVIPREITVSSQLMWELMNLLAGELLFELDAAPALPALDNAVEDLTGFLSR